MKLATRLILEETLEVETRDALGLDYHKRGAEEEGRDYRDGHRTGRLKTAECVHALTRPLDGDRFSTCEALADGPRAAFPPTPV